MAFMFSGNITMNTEMTNETVNEIRNDTIILEKQIEHPQKLSVPIQTQNAALDNHFWFYAQTLTLDTQSDPYLITRLEVIDNNSLDGDSCTNVIGLVWNLGTRVANNCSLNIILYQGAEIAVENKIMLGSIARKNYIDVDLKIFYDGEKITSYAINADHD